MKRPKIVMIGAFPPPIYGMSLINKAVYDCLLSVGAKVMVIDVSANSLDRRVSRRLTRLPKIISALTALICMQNIHKAILYLSVSGGFGQLYEIFITLLARLRGMNIVLHHHNYTYLNIRSRYTDFLLHAAGSSAIHLVLSEEMAEQLRRIYNVSHTVTVSNAVFCFRNEGTMSKSRKTIQTIGFISNISAQKGVFDFIDLFDSITSQKYPLRAMIAGPFQNTRVKHDVRTRLSQMQNIEYVGPKFGSAKDRFFEQIDVLVFPTRYANEAEPLVIIEALSRGIPVIAYGRGCIPEMLKGYCGKAIDVNKKFVPGAFEIIKAWHSEPDTFEQATKAASHRFMERYNQNKNRWFELLRTLTGRDLPSTLKQNSSGGMFIF